MGMGGRSVLAADRPLALHVRCRERSLFWRGGRVRGRTAGERERGCEGWCR